MECGTQATNLHLKISVCHDNRKRTGDKMQFGLDELKTALMSRQALLKKLDPLGILSVPEVCDKLASYVTKYQHIVLQARPATDMDIKGEL